MTVFSQQRIENPDKEEKTQDFLAVTSDEEIKLDIKIQSKNFKLISSIILEAMTTKVEITLEEVIEYMKNNNHDDILNYRPFYDFWIILHQKSPIIIELQEKQEELLFGQAYNVFASKGKRLFVEEIEGIINVTDRFQIRNMNFRLEE